MDFVYIVLINYKNSKDTIECVKSLKKINYNNYKIVVVDNNSNDGSVKSLKEKLKECYIIESSINLGFAGGCNIGIKYSIENGADYILLINNDTLVTVDFLDKLLLGFKCRDNVGIVSGKILYYPQTDIVWYDGGYCNWFKFIGEHRNMKSKNIDSDNSIVNTTFITGCLMLIKKEIFMNVGYLDERYFMYLEDLDYCVRVREKGYKLVYNPKVIIYHKVSISSGGEDSAFSIKWLNKNRLFFMKKYKYKVSKINYTKSIIFFYFSRLIRIFQYLLKFDIKRAKAVLIGIIEGQSRV